MENALKVFLEWVVVLESRSMNRGPYLMAQNVTKYNLAQHGSATGHPDWLHDLFVNEMGFSSV
ncbi:unnamed protein product [Arabidopsis halleri]